ITRDASFRARDAFISPSAAITYGSREKNMRRWSVASSRLLWKRQEEKGLIPCMNGKFLKMEKVTARTRF
uniref:Uncharacterized protein n=1 Tax=Amphiprion percula TaxID=161767 RepID=A0A3P8U8T2_AMPPE